MNDNVSLFRMNLKTAGVDPFEFCKNKEILGFGYPLIDKNKNKIKPKDIDECKKLGMQQYINEKGFIRSINVFKIIKEDDLIWVRYNGIFYICRVLSKWKYENSIEHSKADIVNIIDVEFVEVGTIENVPGKVVNSFRARSTIQHVGHGLENNATLMATMKLYNNITKKKYYDIKPIIKDDILDMFLYEDMEEIVSLYLQVKKNYLVYTSSNKIDTQTYEFVMVSKDGKNLCYAQVKTGGIPLDGKNFEHLVKTNNEVYLFAVSQKYINIDNKNIIALTKDEIISFIYNNKFLMPERVKMWLNN